VSTDEQTVENQCKELHAAASRRGWEIVAEFQDAGISGAKGREDRPGFDALLRAAAQRRKRFEWSWPGLWTGWDVRSSTSSAAYLPPKGPPELWRETLGYGVKRSD
jgi:hypothetical protein